MRALLALATLLVVPQRARASFDEFADSHSPTNIEIPARFLVLTLKGEVELELHDLEGEGGPGFDSATDTRTIGTRSPFAEIDSFWLAVRIGFGEGFGAYSVLEFTADDARVGAVWFDFRVEAPGWLQHHVEVGYHTPIVTLDRRTERYPLIGTSYWRQPELHAAYEATFTLAEQVTLELGASLAMMRPLDFAGVQESTHQPGTINVLSYGSSRVFSGNGPVGGGRLRLTAWGAFVEGFGFAGKLASEAGTDLLRSGFSNYRDLDGYPAEGDGPRDFWWVGGRAGFHGWGVHALVEGIYSREGLLRRWGLYGQLSYNIRLRETETWFHHLEPLVRYEVYRVLGSTTVQDTGRALRSTAPINAVSWDYDVLTLSLITQVYRDILRLRIEYYFIWEKNGVPALDIGDEPFRNNELLVQIELRF